MHSVDAPVGELAGARVAVTCARTCARARHNVGAGDTAAAHMPALAWGCASEGVHKTL